MAPADEKGTSSCCCDHHWLVVVGGAGDRCVAHQASRWRVVFHPNVATTSPDLWHSVHSGFRAPQHMCFGWAREMQLLQGPSRGMCYRLARAA
jgi:hypothetical protein